MERALPATSHAVLGMLSLAPMSGYELTQNVDKTIAHFWQISKSQVYSELARLEELGLVRGTDVAQERLPDKRTYELTAAGEQKLDEWLQLPGHDRHRMRSGLLLKTFFAHRMTPQRFTELVADAKADAEAQRKHLGEIVRLLEGPPETFYSRASALYGLHSAEATIRWADEVAATIPEPRSKPLTDTAFREGAKEVMRSSPARRQKRS